MKRLVMLTLLIVFASTALTLAAGLQVAQGVITTQVKDRMPVDEVKSTAASVGKLYCFTKIVGAEGETTVSHVWYHAGKEVFRISFPVKGASWRVYSAKTIYPEMTGEWKVDVLDASGTLLSSIPFTVN
ncbi:MAG TPA: DUF2914 domain-containing protein [Geobacterales bacterium]|nr:DUF2914 domain-containing protein [Geobacterales bacterium]